MPSVFTDINHICIVTHDVDRGVRTWYDRYGVGPWKVFTFDPARMSVEVADGPLEFTMRVGLAPLGPHARVEIIQPLDERSPYAQSLAERGGKDHLHHVRFDVADFDQAIADVEGLGVPKVLQGRYAAKDPSIRSWATYFDTVDDLGVVAEIALLPEGFEMPEPDYVYPPSSS